MNDKRFSALLLTFLVGILLASNVLVKPVQAAQSVTYCPSGLTPVDCQLWHDVLNANYDTFHVDFNVKFNATGTRAEYGNNVTYIGNGDVNLKSDLSNFMRQWMRGGADESFLETIPWFHTTMNLSGEYSYSNGEKRNSFHIQRLLFPFIMFSQGSENEWSYTYAFFPIPFPNDGARSASLAALLKLFGLPDFRKQLTQLDAEYHFLKIERSDGPMLEGHATTQYALSIDLVLLRQGLLEPRNTTFLSLIAKYMANGEQFLFGKATEVPPTDALLGITRKLTDFESAANHTTLKIMTRLDMQSKHLQCVCIDLNAELNAGESKYFDLKGADTNKLDGEFMLILSKIGEPLAPFEAPKDARLPGSC